MKAIVNEAHPYAINVAAHASTAEAIGLAIDAKVRQATVLNLTAIAYRYQYRQQDCRRYRWLYLLHATQSEQVRAHAVLLIPLPLIFHVDQLA